MTVPIHSPLGPEDLKDKWQTMNTESVGKLWLELFRFYTVGFKMADSVINVRQLHPMSKAEKTWSKKIVIEGNITFEWQPQVKLSSFSYSFICR